MDRLGTFLNISIRLLQSTNYRLKNGNFPVQNRGPRHGKPGRYAGSAQSMQSSVAQHLQQKIDVVIEFGERFAQFGDLATGVEDRRMVSPAEIAANLRQ